MKTELVVGTRGSALALAQTSLVCDALRHRHGPLRLRVMTIATRGDAEPDAPIAALGRGVFVTEIESALRDGRIDIAVHSAKDLPSVLVGDVAVAAFLPRADVRDVLISRRGRLRELPAGARIGTSSPRRMCQVRALRPDVDVVEVRGNVGTRIGKVADGRLDAVLLAAAGVIRLGRAAEITEWLDPVDVIPCVGQGALAVEVRAGDAAVRALIGALDDAPTRSAVLAERAFLAELGAGCLAAAAAYARVDGQSLTITAMIGAPDGQLRTGRLAGSTANAEALGAELARQVLRSGAAAFFSNGGSRLRGMRVAVTRAGDQSALLVLLRARGADAVACPTIDVEPVGDSSALDAELRRLDGVDWIAFTSMNAVAAVANRLDALGITLPSRLRIGAVGAGTAAASAARLRSVDFASTMPTADALGASLPDAAGSAVLFPCGDLASDALSDRLAERGARVCRVVAYRTVPGPGVAALLARLAAGTLDAVVFASPSSMTHVAEALVTARAAGGRPLIVCVGPTTADYARSLGFEPDVVAASPSTGGIVEALEQHRA